jgi:hypothetical protein
MYYRDQHWFCLSHPDLCNGPEALVVPFPLATFSYHVLVVVGYFEITTSTLEVFHRPKGEYASRSSQSQRGGRPRPPLHPPGRLVSRDPVRLAGRRPQLLRWERERDASPGGSCVFCSCDVAVSLCATATRIPGKSFFPPFLAVSGCRASSPPRPHQLLGRPLNARTVSAETAGRWWSGRRDAGGGSSCCRCRETVTCGSLWLWQPRANGILLCTATDSRWGRMVTMLLLVVSCP